MADDTPKDEKTEEATPRRRQDARTDGQVAFSTEMMAAAMLLAVVLSGLAAGGQLAGAAGNIVVGSFKNVATLGASEIDLPDFAALIAATGKGFLPSMLMLLGPVVLVGLLLGFGEAGVQFSAKAIWFDANKLIPS
jgi:flagellar biosynthesis protein FlhB